MSNEKLRLSLDRLRVESFATEAAVQVQAGSVYTGAAPCRPTGWIGDCSRYCQ